MTAAAAARSLYRHGAIAKAGGKHENCYFVTFMRGDFGAGTAMRNPPESRHAPRPRPGCAIFVKLWPMHPRDLAGRGENAGLRL